MINNKIDPLVTFMQDNKKFNTFVAYFENGDKSDLKYSRDKTKIEIINKVNKENF